MVIQAWVYTKNILIGKNTMSVHLTSYISFNGEASEAMAFYQSVFGGELTSDTFGGFNEKSGGAVPVADEDKDKIMHAQLVGDNGIKLMAADIPQGMEYTPGQQVALTLNGDDEALLTAYWNKLNDGAQVSIPLSKVEWGDMYGMLIDKFGIKWMVDVSQVSEV